MNTEGEYAVSKNLKLHRWGSLILVMICAPIYLSRFGSYITIRRFVALIFPLALIWYAEQLSVWAIRDSGGWLNASNSDTWTRIFGWLILIISLGIHAFVYFYYQTQII
jgi:hypothetical protein